MHGGRRRGGAHGALRVGLYGGFCAGNTGNDATASITVDRLRTALPEVDLRLITSAEDPQQVAEAFDLEVVTLYRERSPWMGVGIGRFVSRPWNAARDLVRTWVAVRSVDAVVVVGGGIFESEAAAGPQGWIAMAGLFVLSVASSIGKHSLAFVGVGGTYLPTHTERRLLAASLRRADYRSFRDHGTLQAGVRMGGAGPRDHVTADLAFAADLSVGPPEVVPVGRSSDPERPDPAHSDPAQPNDAQRAPGHVALGVMAFSWITRDEHGNSGHDPYVQALVGATVLLAEQGDEVVVFCGDIADLWVVEQVVELAHDRLTPGGNAHRVAAISSIEFADHLRELALTDVVVCSRFHNAVAALLLERATVAVADRIKVRDLLARVGLQEYVLEARGLTSDELVRRVRLAQERASAITLELAPVVAIIRNQAVGELDELAHLIARWSGQTQSRPAATTPGPTTGCEDVVSPS